MLIIPLNTQQSHINRILRNPFHVCSNHTTFELQRTRIRSTPFVGYISDTPVTMKQSQSHQIYNDNVDLKIIIVHSLKDLVLKVYGEKTTTTTTLKCLVVVVIVVVVFQTRKQCQLCPLYMRENKK